MAEKKSLTEILMRLPEKNSKPANLKTNCACKESTDLILEA
jgi:hypothetical protein